jgi:hypothetical protein
MESLLIMRSTLNLDQRIGLLVKLGDYMSSNDERWLEIKHRAFLENNWFIPEFIDLAVANIVKEHLDEEKLRGLATQYNLADETPPSHVGIVMAGNIPLVGFHDLLSVFITGHKAIIKPSTKDEVLVKHLVEKLLEWEPKTENYFSLQFLLKNCDAYIATGSNNSSTLFEYYFRNIPSIIRRNRTSVAVLTGKETHQQLELLADDVYLFFGLGCRNVTKIFVPRGYEFLPLLNAFRKYNYLADHHKYKNNYDYNLALHLLNNTYYMTNESILLIENPSPFSPISQLNYEFYDDEKEIHALLKNKETLQCVIGESYLSFGAAQKPALCDFADGVDTIEFLRSLPEKYEDHGK